MVEFKDVLQSHTLAQLRKIVANMNVANYIKVKGKDVKIGKAELIKLMVSQYSMGKDTSGKDIISRNKYLPQAKGTLGATLDKKALQDTFGDMVESGELTIEEAEKEYRRALKKLQEEGTIFKAKRKNPQAKPKPKAKKATKSKAKKEPKETKEDSMDLTKDAKSLGEIVEGIQEISRNPKKNAQATAEGYGFETPKEALELFQTEYDKNIDYIEANMDKKGIKGHLKKFTALLKKVKVATSTTAKRNKFGVSDQVGGGIFTTLAGAIPMLMNMIKKK